MMTDPLLKKYRYTTTGAAKLNTGLVSRLASLMVHILLVILSVLMLDEAHERTLYTDIAIGLLKKVTRL